MCRFVKCCTSGFGSVMRCGFSVYASFALNVNYVRMLNKGVASINMGFICLWYLENLIDALNI